MSPGFPRAEAVLTPDEFIAIGRALYGDGRWQTELAAALRKSRRHVNRLAAGDYPVNADIARQLLTITQAKAAALLDVAGRITKVLP